MMANFGVHIPPADLALIREYLVTTYPERAKPAGAVLPGPFKVSMTQWPAATPGSRVHDPLAARDGMLWYTGQMVNALGRVDPGTGAVKEFPLKTPNSGRTASPRTRTQHLVQRQRRGAHRQARSAHGPSDRVQDAAGAGGRSAHAALRSRRDSLVYRAERQRHRPPRSAQR